MGTIGDENLVPREQMYELCARSKGCRKPGIGPVSSSGGSKRVKRTLLEEIECEQRLCETSSESSMSARCSRTMRKNDVVDCVVDAPLGDPQ